MTLASPRWRAVTLLLLLALLFGLAVWYGTLGPAPAANAYPGAEELADGRAVGERAVVGGPVVGTGPVVIAAAYGDGETLRATVLDAPPDVEPGDRLTVYGTAETRDAVRAERVVRQPRSGYWYAYAVSLLAGLWTLGRTVRHWRVDRDGWGLARRDPTRSLRDRIRGPHGESSA